MTSSNKHRLVVLISGSGTNLQAIIDGAASGDLITLAPMTTGGVTVTGKNLTLRGIGASRPSIGSLTATGCTLNGQSGRPRKHAL